MKTEDVFIGDRVVDSTPTPDATEGEDKLISPIDEDKLKKEFEEVENQLPTKILEDPKLFENLNKELDKKVEGEYEARKSMRKKFKNNPPCPKCNQILPVVYIGDNEHNKKDEYYCSWCNKIFKKCQ